ncbi:MAG: hypothetical protein V7K55_01650 [Nostoc sp.]|uniref:hypothetical protein n=1 Tax=Nostoc sp. TaxID=1180 RepID=UPI002FF5663F
MGKSLVQQLADAGALPRSDALESETLLARDFLQLQMPSSLTIFSGKKTNKKAKAQNYNFAPWLFYLLG